MVNHNKQRCRPDIQLQSNLKTVCNEPITPKTTIVENNIGIYFLTVKH